MNPSLIGPDIFNALSGPGQQPPAPQAQPVPPPPQAQEQPYNINDIFQAQQASGTKITDYLQKLTEVMKPSARELDLQKISANTPEKRAQDLYNQMFGISHEDMYDPTNRNPDQSPTGQKTHIDWKKAIPGFLGEISRAYSQGKNYVPAQERTRQTALQQYQAEINPLKSELGIEAQNKRAMMADTINLLGKEVANNHWLGSNLVQKQKADQQKELIAIKQTLAPIQAQKLEAEIQRLHSQNDVAGAEKLLKQAQTQFIKVKTGNEDVAASEKEANKLKIADIMAGIRSKQITELNGVPSITDKRTNQSVAIQAPGVPSSGQSVTNGQTGTLPVGQRPEGIPPPPQPATIQVPGQTPKTVMPGVPSKIPVTWETPEDKYGKGRPTFPITQKFPDTPPGHDPTNDAVLNDVTSHFTADQKKVVRTALDLYSKGDAFVKGLEAIPDSAFGTISGNLNKWLSGQIDISQLGGSKEIQDKLQYLRGLAPTIAVSHLGAQGIRSGEMSKLIADDINSWGTSKSAIIAHLKGYIDQGGETLRHTPGSKVIAAPEIGSYFEMMRLYHPEMYEKYKQGIADELKRRQKK